MNATTSAIVKRPRVVVVGPGPAQAGGVATFVDILLSSPYMQERYELIHLDTTRGARGAGVASQLALINIAYFLRQAIEFVRIVVRYRPHLMHVPMTSYWAYWKDAAFTLMARALGMKVVAHLHGGMFDRYYRQSSPLVQRLIGWTMYRADVVIALSSWWRRFLLEEIRPDIDVQVVPNTVDSMFAEGIDKPSESAGRDANLVLFVGGLGHRKGVFDILKAVPLVLERRPDVRFIFAGTEERQGEQTQIDRACAEANLDGVVQFLGQITGRAKLDLFLKASVFILPSYGENLPYALLEAMSVGLPVVTTPVGAIPELVEDGHNGFLIRPGDYQALADRIVRLLEDAALRATMSQANRERIQAGYMPDVAMSRFDKIYSRLLDVHLERGQWMKGPPGRCKLS